MQRTARKAMMNTMTMNGTMPVSFLSPPVSAAASSSMVLPPVSVTNRSVQMKPSANGMHRTSTTALQLVAPLTWKAAIEAIAPRTMEEAEPPKRANAWHHATPVLRSSVG